MTRGILLPAWGKMTPALLNRPGIYEILNTVNGKRYIGSAHKLGRRWKDHQYSLRRGDHHSKALQRAWNKYGEKAFRFLVILTCAPTDEMLFFYEQQLITKVSPEYNTAKDVRRPMLGLKHSEEAKKKNGDARRGKKMPPRSDAHRKALSEANKGKSRGVGRKNTAEAKERMRQAALKREKKPLSQAQLDNLARMTESNRGRKRPDISAMLIGNTRAHGGLGVKKHPGRGAKVSAGLKGNTNGKGKKGKKYGPQTPEHIAARVAGMKKAKAERLAAAQQAASC